MGRLDGMHDESQVTGDGREALPVGATDASDDLGPGRHQAGEDHLRASLLQRRQNGDRASIHLEHIRRKPLGLSENPSEVGVMRPFERGDEPLHGPGRRVAQVGTEEGPLGRVQPTIDRNGALAVQNETPPRRGSVSY